MTYLQRTSTHVLELAKECKEKEKYENSSEEGMLQKKYKISNKRKKQVSAYFMAEEKQKISKKK